MNDLNRENFQPPPPPQMPESEVESGPIMSTAETLTGIFFEPGRVFESLRARPRFLVAGLIIIAVSLTFTALFFQRIGYENAIREAMEKSPRSSQMSSDQKERYVEFYQKPYIKAIIYNLPAIGFSAVFALGAALYLLGAMAMGRRISYWQALSVWVYSSFPPFVLSGLLSILVLYLKSVDDIDPTQRRSLINADLSVLLDEKAAPVMVAALGSIDLFAFYGLFLAALGLRKVGKLSPGAAWTIVLTIWIIKVVLRIIWATAFGTAVG